MQQPILVAAVVTSASLMLAGHLKDYLTYGPVQIAALSAAKPLLWSGLSYFPCTPPPKKRKNVHTFPAFYSLISLSYS